MSNFSKAAINAAIEKSPIDHEKKRPYVVYVTDNRGKTLRVVYVLSWGRRRAELTGIRVDRHIFSGKGCGAEACPYGWKHEAIGKEQAKGQQELAI